MTVAEQVPRIVGIIKIPPEGGVAVALADDEDAPASDLLGSIMRALSAPSVKAGV